MDKSRLAEDRRVHKCRYTYCCSEEQLRCMKILAADMHIPVNKLVERAIYTFARAHYSIEDCEALLNICHKTSIFEE